MCNILELFYLHAEQSNHWSVLLLPHRQTLHNVCTNRNCWHSGGQEQGLLYNTDTMKESGATGRVDGPVLERRVDRSLLPVAAEPAANTRSAPTLQVSHFAITSPPFLITCDPNLGVMFCCLVKKDKRTRSSTPAGVCIIKSVVHYVRGSSKWKEKYFSCISNGFVGDTAPSCF